MIKKIIIFFIVFIQIVSVEAQQYVSTKIAIPISLKHKYPLYSMFFTGSNSFLATELRDKKEYIKKFEFNGGNVIDKGLAIQDTGIAIGGQINGRPYLYMQYKGDVIPGYPDESPFIFDTQNEEVFVGGHLENLFVITKIKNSLDICRIKENWRHERYEAIPILSDPNLDENGIHVIGDSIFFSRKDSTTGHYSLYKSIRNEDIFGEEEWSKPIRMPFPYNIEGTNSLFYLWYEGIEYITSDRDGILSIYAIGNLKKLNDKLGESIVEEYSHKLKHKIRDKTYEEYVSSNNYGFYNNIIDLTDSIHSDATIHVQEVPIENISDKKISIIYIINIIDEEKKWYLATTSDGDTITLIPVEIAKEAGIEIGNNIITADNIVQEKYKKILDNKYIACKESLFPQNNNGNIANIDNSLYNTDKIEDLRYSINYNMPYHSKELIQKIQAEGYTHVYIQIGWYTKQPSINLQSLMPNGYSYKLQKASLNTGTEFFFRVPVQIAFDLFLLIEEKRKKTGAVKGDTFFIRVGERVENFNLYWLKEDKFILQ